MSVELEHAIGCNVENRCICHQHPNGKDYVKALGAVILVGSLHDPHEQEFLQGHDDFITCVAVSHRGDFIASGQQGANADVILWSFASRRQVFCFQEQDHGIDCICFSHDDRFLCVCGDIVDGRLFVYDTNSGLITAWAQCCPKPTISILTGGMVKDIKRRDTNEYLFSCFGGKTLSLWHLDAEHGVLSSHAVNNSGKQSREYMCMAFTMDYEYLIAGTTTGDIAVVLMKNRVLQTLVPVCSAGVINMVCLPASHGVELLCGGGDGTITLMNGPSAIEMQDSNKVRLDGPIKSLSLSGDQQEVMAVTAKGTSYLVRCKDLSVKLHNQVSPGALYHVAYPMGISDMFLTCGNDGIVTLWDANDYSARLKCPVRNGAHPTSCTASEDILVAGCSDATLMAFDCAQGRNLWQIDNSHKGGVTSVQLASNMRFFVSGGTEGELRVWELRTKEMASHLKEHKARVNDVKLFPNDQYAISVSRDRCLFTWDLRSEKRLTAHRENHGGINCLAVASNQTTVITAGQEKTLTYWDLRMADPIRSIDLDEEVMTLSMTSDDRYLASAGTGMVVKVWDVNAGAVVSQGSGHSRTVQKVAFSPDNKQIVSVALDHAAMVWNLYT